MSARKNHRDDILFISALAAMLIGLGFLLRTTGLARSYKALWPISILAAGCLLAYFAHLRGKGGAVLLGGGVFFSFSGVVILVGALSGWRIGHVWPLIMASAGLSILLAGLRYFGRIRPSFGAPAIGFIVLGLAFSLFSFHIVGISFRHFIRVWWPCFFILGGIVLFIAYGANRRGKLGKSEHPDKK